jgi:pimeloyl-ACP methyl ester carboxylesterase
MTGRVEAGGHQLEYVDLPGSDPPFLLLHEGLGSVSMWREFPQQLAQATGARVVAYSRAGFGQSTPRSGTYGPRFVHEEAEQVIPTIRAKLALQRPVVLGHSTGASMALVHAATSHPVAGVIAMAPLITIEGSNLAAILEARKTFEASRDWRVRLARHHEDVKSVFYGWNDTWLSPQFREWNILPDLARIRAPVLAILGAGDEYSTPRQVALIREHLPAGTRFDSLLLAECGHAPHRDQPGPVLAEVRKFLAAL